MKDEASGRERVGVWQKYKPIEKIFLCSLCPYRELCLENPILYMLAGV